MIRLVWLLVTVEVLGLPFELSVWEAHLKAIDSSLPTTTANNLQICYFYDLDQTCAGDAIGTLLRQAPVNNVLTWTPSVADCSKLLEKQLPALGEAASSLFKAAIASAATAGVTNFELLAQSWVLRVGHHALSVNHAAFVSAFNSISNWKTVHCDGANLAYDGKTIAKPNFVGAVDCDILDILYADACIKGSCTLAEAGVCCGSSKTGVCCAAHLPAVQSECNANTNCAYKSTCCSVDPASTCCTGLPNPCASKTCSLAEAVKCCGTDKLGLCCQTQAGPVQDLCMNNLTCGYKEDCCGVYATSLCCVEANCGSMFSTFADSIKCCRADKTSRSCRDWTGRQDIECRDNASCDFKDLCCSRDLSNACCGEMPPICGDNTCSFSDALTCLETFRSKPCFAAHFNTLWNTCQADINCAYKNECCLLDNESSCCKGADPCHTDQCPDGKWAFCCTNLPDGPCCTRAKSLCNVNNCSGHIPACCEVNGRYGCCVDS